MDSEIKTFKLEDVLQGGFNKGSLAKFKVQYDFSKCSSAADPSGGSTSTAPLDDISLALYDAYLKGGWCHKQGSTVSAPLYAAVLRVALLPWSEPPQAVATSFASRLKRGEDLAHALDVPLALHRQALLRALEANKQLGAELQLQIAVIKRGVLPGVLSTDPALSKEAYAAWQSSAVREAEALLHWNNRLPEFNGLLQLSVIGAQGLQLNKGSGFFKKPSTANPYAAISILDASGVRIGQRHSSSVQHASPNPQWSLSLPPVLLSSEACEVVCKVKHSSGQGGAAKSSGDSVLGKTGLRLRGLQTCLPLRMELELFGQTVKAEGGCGCFGGGGAAVVEDDDEGPATTRSRPSAQSGDLETRIVYDPESDQMKGASSRPQQGSLFLELTYMNERRPRHESGAAGGAGGGSSETYEAWLSRLLVQTLPQDPTASEAAMTAFQTKHRRAKMSVQSSDGPPPPPPPPGSPSSVDPPAMFHRLAAALHRAHSSGLSAGLQPFGGERGPEPRQGPGPGAGAAAGKGQRSADRLLLSSIEAVDPGRLLADFLSDPAVAPHLPLGWGLPLLLQFGKLYRVRPQLQRMVLLQYMLLEAGSSISGMLGALMVGWRPCLLEQHEQVLTSDEMQGLAAVMGLFLHQAVPLLNNHYSRLPHDAGGAASFLLLLEMVGWAATWHPEAELPLPLFQESLTAAVRQRLVPELRVSAAQLDAAVLQVTSEVGDASADLRRDLELQRALPGLRSYVLDNCSLRYNTFTDHLEMVFAYNPGRNLGDMKVLFDLEAAVSEHHQLLVHHGLATKSSSAPGQLPPERSSASASAAAGPSSKQLSLYDLEYHMVNTLQMWISKGSVDLLESCPRSLAVETWVPASVQEPFGQSSVELQRIMNVYLEPWIDACCAAGPVRQGQLGRTIVSSLVELLSTYARAFESYWNQMMAAREFSLEAIGKPTHAHARSMAAKPFSSTMATIPGSSLHPGPAHSASPASKTGMRSMMVATHARKRSESGKAVTPGLPDAETLANALQQAEPGILLNNAMCTLTATLVQLIKDTKDLGESLADYLKEEGEGDGSSRAARNGSAGGGGQMGLGLGLEFPAGTPEYLVQSWSQLVDGQQQVLASLTTSYSIQYRDSLLRMLMSAFGAKAGEASSTRALEGILSAVNDELTCIIRNLKPSVSSSADADASSLSGMVHASWRGAMSSLKLLALNQAHFRALQPEEADWAREFMMSLKQMYEEELPAPSLVTFRQQESDALRSPSSGSALRAIHYGYCSSLLHAVTADSADLCSMYEAQFRCLQQAQLHAGGLFIELGPSQISLLDILRVLKQRRRLEEPTRLFVNAQLQQAEAIATQVVFGLSSQERVVAEFRCYLAADADQAELIPRAASPLAHTTRPPRPSQSPFGLAGKQQLSPPRSSTSTSTSTAQPDLLLATSIAGRLYLTQSCICYTTMFDGDLKQTSDTTITLLRSEVQAALRAASVDGLSTPCMVLTTKDHDVFCMAGFHAGDSVRLMNLLSSTGDPASLPGRQSTSGGAPTPRVQNAARGNGAEVLTALPARLDTGAGAGAGTASRESSPRAKARSASTPAAGTAANGQPLVMSVPCYLYGTLLNTEGVLGVYKDRLDFINQHEELVHSVPMDQIQQITQRPLPLLQVGSGSLLTVQVDGMKKRELEFGGITDALIASLKSTLSDLCFEA